MEGDAAFRDRMVWRDHLSWQTMFIHRIQLTCLASLLVVLTSCGGGQSGPSEITQFDHFVLQGGPTLPQGEYVIRSAAELGSLRPYFLDPLPSVHDSREMVVGVSRGASRFCMSLLIEKVEYTPSQVSVRYKVNFTYIGSSCLTPPPISSGTLGDFVVVPFSSLPIVFVESTE